MQPTHLLLLSALLHLTSGCRLLQRSTLASDEPYRDHVAQMMEGYDPDRHTFTNAFCVDWMKADQSLVRPFAGQDVFLNSPWHRSTGVATGATVTYRRDLSRDDLIRSFDGSLAAGLTTPGVSASASVEYATRHAASAVRESHSIIATFTGDSLEATPGGQAVASSLGQDAAKEFSDALRLQTCGSEYVNRIDFGGSFIATLSVDFANELDRMRFAGSLNVDVADSVSVAGKLSYLDQETLERMKVNVEAHQVGGKPGELLTVLNGESVISCRANQMQQCIDAFKRLIAYARAWPKQFDQRSTKGMVVTGYHTATYPVTTKLAHPRLSPAVAADLTEQERLLELDYVTTLGDMHRAELLLKQFNVPAELANQLTLLSQAAAAANELRARALDSCFNNPADSCVFGNGADGTPREGSLPAAARQAREQHPYDPSLLELVPKTFTDWCQLFNERDAIFDPSTQAGVVASQSLSAALSTVKALLDLSQVEAKLEPRSSYQCRLVAQAGGDQQSRCVESATQHLAYPCGAVQQALIALPVIDLSGADVSDIRPLAALASSLTSLTLKNKAIGGGITALINAKKLRTLDLSQTRLVSYQSLGTLNHLQELTLDASAVQDVSFVRGMTVLRKLNVRSLHLSYGLSTALAGHSTLEQVYLDESSGIRAAELLHAILLMPALNRVTVTRSLLIDPGGHDTAALCSVPAVDCR